ncbi:M28 family peptidase [Pseudalkalibacillus decolorationis]|uniref:M28 family peptidase n=1 Tax=Pseudalkalibacillus decolorationis TaxID=163879 RepID=UPI0021497C4C|nr:M28 family peptidase [Pseudalkalibacillus decolorationis]
MIDSGRKSITSDSTSRRRKRRKSLGLVFVSLLSLSLVTSAALPSQAQTQNNSITGFAEEKSDWQQQFEAIFSEKVSTDEIKQNSRTMSKRIPLVGTKGNESSLNYELKQLRKAGLDPEVKSYSVYMSEPKNISVTQTAPQQQELKVIEDLPPEFAKKVVPGYNAYSPAGNVEAELVYANYGRPEDFAELERRGISVKDKIVIVRYGKNFRGVKPEQAAKRGAIGMIIYSDPADDGYTKGAVYPEGPWRPADAIQRGSILYIFRYPGDPLTPGKPSISGVKRINPDDAESLPTIPTTPLSYGEASPLLESMQGQEAPESWQGALPFTYNLGPGPAKVRLSLDIDYKRKPVNDVIVRIPGSKYPEQTIVIGAHRDTWVEGASDNISGWTAAMEIARVLGKMYQKGWQPERSIVIAGWDGEEYGLLGSTEWVEENRKDLTKNAVAYLNMDGVAGQFFNSSGVPSMQDLIHAVTKTVEEPRSGLSIYDDWFIRSGREIPKLGQLGSGSDYTAFIDHIGVPSAGIGFSTPGGLYHSAYDNSDSIERFFDPGYKHHAAASRVTGKVALRLANADVIPLQYSDYADNVVSLLEDMADKNTTGVDLSNVINQAREWKAEAEALERKADGILEDGKITRKERRQLKHINHALIQQERDLTRKKGLPERPWFKHQVWAPGLTTGYAAQPLPALAKALKDGEIEAFQQAAKQLEKALFDATKTTESVQ